MYDSDTIAPALSDNQKDRLISALTAEHEAGRLTTGPYLDVIHDLYFGMGPHQECDTCTLRAR
ncbi:hypothetical protein GCM10010123_24550 [Pilimelia anulata]|uniref:Uncharacterized protein n=1 Tax=Pilimelia anulata TaxID=53371 RepID=A0A8J3B3V0_9ACTN|nr:hypothetical protein [Pilimelia anulata]GGJ93794.1 hypothetical protein GCM10010123_24550 [Pilimelia anulata]